MKVELDDIRVAHSNLSDKIFAGVLAPVKNEAPPLWKHKKDVTNDFIAAVISRWENKTENISLGKSQWEITVKKLS